jgi:hypothetical protein
MVHENQKHRSNSNKGRGKTKDAFRDSVPDLEVGNAFVSLNNSFLAFCKLRDAFGKGVTGWYGLVVVATSSSCSFLFILTDTLLSSLISS